MKYEKRFPQMTVVASTKLGKSVVDAARAVEEARTQTEVFSRALRSHAVQQPDPPCPNCGGELVVDNMTERGHCVGQCHWVFDMEAMAANGALAHVVSAPPAPLGQEGVDALSPADQRSRLKAMLKAWESEMSVRRQVEAKVRLQTMGQPVSARGYHPTKIVLDEHLMFDEIPKPSTSWA